jgi:hypothetical protein
MAGALDVLNIWVSCQPCIALLSGMKKIVLYFFHQDLKSGKDLFDENLSDSTTVKLGNILINKNLGHPTMVVLSYCLVAEAAEYIERSNFEPSDLKSMRSILNSMSSYIFSPTMRQDLNYLNDYRNKSDSKKQELSLNLPFTNFLHKMIENERDLRWIKLAIKCGVHPEAKNKAEETAFQVKIILKHSSLLMQIQWYPL